MFQKYESEKLACADEFEKWHEHFAALLERDRPDSENLIDFLRAGHTLCAIYGETDFTAPETNYDRLYARFEVLVSACERIVERLLQLHGKQASMSYDFGYTHYASFAAHRCRDPVLRRRAIQALRRHPRQEGLFISTSAANLAERLMLLEEAGLGEVKAAADVPETKRVWLLDYTISIDEGIVDVKFFQRRTDSSPTTKTDRFVWKLVT